MSILFVNFWFFEQMFNEIESIVFVCITYMLSVWQIYAVLDYSKQSRIRLCICLSLFHSLLLFPIRYLNFFRCSDEMSFAKVMHLFICKFIDIIAELMEQKKREKRSAMKKEIRFIIDIIASGCSDKYYLFICIDKCRQKIEKYAFQYVCINEKIETNYANYNLFNSCLVNNLILLSLCLSLPHAMLRLKDKSLAKIEEKKHFFVYFFFGLYKKIVEIFLSFWRNIVEYHFAQIYNAWILNMIFAS